MGSEWMPFLREGVVKKSERLRRDWMGMDGAGDGIRTRDPNLGKVVLYQLSYSRSLCILGQVPPSVDGGRNRIRTCDPLRVKQALYR